MNDSIFKAEIENTMWYASDSSQLKAHKQMFIRITEDSLVLSYFNWIEYLSETRCTYTSIVTNNIFELQTSSCTNSGKIKYVYGSLENETLKVQLTEKQLIMDKNLLKKDGWFIFSNADLLLDEFEEDDW